jgi:hypothetical protein
VSIILTVSPSSNTIQKPHITFTWHNPWCEMKTSTPVFMQVERLIYICYYKFITPPRSISLSWHEFTYQQYIYLVKDTGNPWVFLAISIPVPTKTHTHHWGSRYIHRYSIWTHRYTHTRTRGRVTRRYLT